MNTMNKPSKTLLKIFISAVAGLFLLQPLMVMPIAIAEDSDTTIDTGDVLVLIDVENDLNQNDFTTGPGDGTATTTNETGTNASSTEAVIPEGMNNCPQTASTTDETPLDCNSVDVNNSNDAELGNGLNGNGNSGGNGIGPNNGNSSINTGNVGIGSVLDNDVNGNNTEVPCEDACDSGATTSPNVIDVDNNNTATTTNDVGLNGNSGANTISSTTGEATITTGDIGIFNAIINFINTNFFGKGREFFVNIFSHIVGTIDLSGFGDDYLIENQTTPECGVIDCYININNSSTSTLANDVNIDANTGVNTIASTTGPAIIETGDITILNDIVNVNNLNITGSDWFFAVVNIFGILEGDIILPAIDDQAFWQDSSEVIEQLAPEASLATEFIVTNSNFADVLNDSKVLANTGKNKIASSSGSNLIRTGNAITKVKALNLVNLNFIGDRWRLTQINLFGDWHGLVHSLPPGYSYFEDDNGTTIYNDSFNDDIFNDAYAQLTVANTNNASTTNNVNINANTGTNAILHSESDAEISTGDIYVGSNLLNFINSNFIGNSWEFSMINVFGDWQGNLAFGQPDLWITESVSNPGPVRNGDYVTYTFLFGNSGDGLATNVIIEDNFNELLMGVAEAAGGSNGGGSILWNLDQLPPNSQGSMSYTVRVRDDIPSGENESINNVSISSAEGDRDNSNNLASGAVIVAGGNSGSEPYRDGFFNPAIYGGSDIASLAVIKTNDADDVVHPGDMVNYQIIIKNIGSVSLYEVLAADVMTDETGETEINKDFWDLETVYQDEEIIIDYTIEIESDIKSGVYTNEFIVEGYEKTRDVYISAVASSKIKVENPDYEDGLAEETEVTVLGEEGEPQLTISRITRTNFVNPGGHINYELIITNNGNLTAYNVVANEDLPDGLTYGDDNSTNKWWELGDIAPGEFKNTEYTILAASSMKPGLYTITATAKADNNGQVSASADLEVRAIAVLAATGFNVKEFIALLLTIAILISYVVILRKKYLT